MINIMWTVRYIVTERFACLGFFQGSIVRVLQLNEENYFPHISYIYIYGGGGLCGFWVAFGEKFYLVQWGGSGMLGYWMRIQMISPSSTSGGEVLLRNLTLVDSSAMMDVWLSSVIVLCVKSL